jgi:hypothetical protein
MHCIYEQEQDHEHEHEYEQQDHLLALEELWPAVQYSAGRRGDAVGFQPERRPGQRGGGCPTPANQHTYIGKGRLGRLLSLHLHFSHPSSSRYTPTMAPSYTPIALQHVNLVVPRGTLHVAKEFYGEVIGFASDPVPQLQKDVLLWYVGGV